MLTKSMPAGSSDGAAGDSGAEVGSAAGAADESGDSFFEEPVLPAADAVDSVPEVPDSEEALTAAESRAVRVPAEEDVVSMDPDPEFVAAVFPQPARSARAEQRARTVFPACFIFFMRVSFMSVTESVSFFHRAMLVSSDMRYVQSETRFHREYNLAMKNRFYRKFRKELTIKGR